MKNVLVMCFVVILLCSGCSWFMDEEGIEQDRAEQQEVLDGLFVTYWKGAKISIRSVPIDEHTQSINFEEIKAKQASELNLGKHLSRIYDSEAFLKDAEAPPSKPISTAELVEIAQEIYVMADTIEGMDEDQYPTFAEVLHHSSRVLHEEPFTMPDDWSNSMDHWMFAIVMESRFGFGSWKTYEFAKVDPQALTTTDYRIVANLHKGINYLRNEWYFLADESFSQAIVEANDPNLVLQAHTKEILKEAKVNDLSEDEQFKLVMRACAYLLRGFSRHQADSKALNEQAPADIELAIADFKRLGVDNELVWLAESYINIKNEEKEKAIVSLSKLEASQYITNKERALLAQAKQHIGERDSASALNFVTDKVIIYRLGFNYAMAYASEIDWINLLEQTEQGRKILARFAEIDQTIEKTKQYLSVDSLTEKGQGLLKDLVAG